MAVTINASTSAGLVQTADTSGTLNLQSAGTTILSASPTGVAVTGTLTATGGFPGGGQLQTELFTAPGTWTKPASCTQVRVTVVGAGGSGALPGGPGVITPQPGGTSSFGPAVSATGGTGAPAVASPGTAGAGTVSVGTALKRGDVSFSTSGIVTFTAGLIGNSSNFTTGPSAAIAYSTTLTSVAGAKGGPNGGAGGLAQAIVPVSAPVSVTVGAAGAVPNVSMYSAVGGAVVVEFVG